MTTEHDTLFNQQINRVSTCLAHGDTKEMIHDKLAESGMDEEMIFLIYKAGEMQFNDFMAEVQKVIEE